MLKRLLDAWRRKRKDTLTTRYVGQSEYMDAVTTAFKSLIDDYSMVCVESQYSKRSFGNFLVRFVTPTFEFQVVRDRGVCAVEMRRAGSGVEEHWIGYDSLLEALGYEVAEPENVLTEPRSITLAEVSGVVTPVFPQMAQLFASDQVAQTYAQVERLYERNRARFEDE